MSYIGTEPKDVRSFGRAKFDYTASQGQTAFTGADDDGKTLAFTDGQIEVFVNGILMDESDFSTSNGNTVTLASAANLNDIVSITALQTDIPNSDYVPATGGTFSGDVDFGSNKITYANLYNNVSDLPSASTYHGMFAHVHNTGLAYYSHAGAWIPLANTTGATFSGNIVASDGINLGGTGASNKLDDYEEGSFTYTMNVGNSSFVGVTNVTYTGTAYYTKIGKFVCVQYPDYPVQANAQAIYSYTLPFTSAYSGAAQLGECRGAQFRYGGTTIDQTLSGPYGFFEANDTKITFNFTDASQDFTGFIYYPTSSGSKFPIVTATYRTT